MQIQLYTDRIFVYRKPIDFRMGIQGLISLVTLELKENPQKGGYFFYNRRRDGLKCLCWHKNGFILVMKRLEKGKFCFGFEQHKGTLEISTQEMGWLMAGLPWQTMREWGTLEYQHFN